MAYLHCHTKGCGWSQDDFWNYNWTWKALKDFLLLRWQKRSFGYNPLSILLEDIATWIKPRYIEMDSYWAKENGYESPRIHSWNFIPKAFQRYQRVKRNMLFKTWEEFRDNDQTPCPKCGKVDWDVD